MRVRKLPQRRGWAFTFGASVLRPTFLLTARWAWRDGLKIPASGGCILAVNHLSHVDPLAMAVFTHDHGRLPRYLAKAELFEVPVVGSLMRALGQIPVTRSGRAAAGAYDDAVAAVGRGECVVVYPEGTITKDPDLWPMVAKTGAARIALATGCPVIPVGQWGAQRLLAPYARRPDLFPRKEIAILVGDPVPLDDLRAQQPTAAVVAEATRRIMDAVTALVAELRDEPAPAERFDPRRERDGREGDGQDGRDGHDGREAG